jgi:hypothetical protein
LYCREIGSIQERLFFVRQGQSGVVIVWMIFIGGVFFESACADEKQRTGALLNSCPFKA